MHQLSGVAGFVTNYKNSVFRGSMAPTDIGRHSKRVYHTGNRRISYPQLDCIEICASLARQYCSTLPRFIFAPPSFMESLKPSVQIHQVKEAYPVLLVTHATEPDVFLA